jgi:hypothetical protein
MAETIVAMDASLEVPMVDLWDLCKRTTIWVCEALQRDPIVVSYDDTARVVDTGAISSLKYRAVYGANVQDALKVAKEMLLRGRVRRDSCSSPMRFRQRTAGQAAMSTSVIRPPPKRRRRLSARCSSALGWGFAQTSCS